MQQWSYKKSLSERIEEIEKIMTIDNAYLFLLPEPCDNDRVDDWSCPEKLNLVAKIENGIRNIPRGPEYFYMQQNRHMFPGI